MSNAIHTGHYEVRAYQNAEGWHYHLNDGLFDVGPYPSEQEAVEAAIGDLRELPGLVVKSITRVPNGT